MLCPGLLFLLLVSSCLLVLGTPPGSSPDEGPQSHDNQQKDVFKKFGTWLKKHYKDIGDVLIATLEPVPIAGQPISAALKTLMLLTPQADPLDIVMSELKALNVKFDTFRAEMKWDAWAAGAFLIPVNNIEKAWVKYTELMLSVKQTTNSEKEALTQDYFTFYSQYTDNTLVLHKYLTAKPVSLTQNLGDLLADRLRCHEKDIKAQFLYLNKVMYKGNMLNEKYYEFKGINTKARVNQASKIASQAASALTTSHQRCISDSDVYIERDIFEQIDDTKKHQQIADSVRAFLEKTYDRYDWMVVAFTTQHSKHKPKLLKRHVLSGFTEVERGAVTVAVAKQVKGSHSKAAAVKEAIRKCIPESVKMCVDVAQKLEECRETVFGKRFSQTYTAVHAFKIKSQTSTSAVEVPEDEDLVLTESTLSSPPSSLFTGKCGKLFGKFVVFIKSDEEIMGEKPCSKVKCGKNGKCVDVSGTLLAMCECQYPYYGEHCEMSLESYKSLLQWEPERRTPNPERFRKGMSVPPANRRPSQGTQGRSAQRQSLQPIPGKSANRRSQQKNSAKGRPRKKTSRSSAKRRARKKTSRGSAKRRPRKKTPRGSAKRRARKKTPRGSAKRRPRTKTPRGSAKRRPRTKTPRGSAKGRPLKKTPRDSAKRRPRLNNQKPSKRERSNSRPRTPGHSGYASFCGSLCVDKTH
ncbi:uncharacterized protein LOC108898308 isoform X1 [Lates calcarifer]|nr:uncharacterized protein LOC108898308 isoform X1 [Lates calcarifer]